MSQVEEFKTLASRVSSEIMSAVTNLQQGKDPDGSVGSAHVEAALLSLTRTAHRLNVDAGTIATAEDPKDASDQQPAEKPEASEEPVAKPAEGPVAVSVDLPAKE